MVSKWGVFIYCIKENGKFYHHYIESDSLIGCTRFVNTFKPRRGYKVVKVEIQEAEQLELEIFDKVRGYKE